MAGTRGSGGKRGDPRPGPGTGTGAAPSVVCFDLSETLVAWSAAYEASLREAMREWVGRLGDEAEGTARIEAAMRAFRERRKAGQGKAAAVRAAAAVLQTADDERTARHLGGAARRLQPGRAKLAPGAEETLRALAPRHRLAIVTNLDPATARALWERLQLSRFVRESDLFAAPNGLRKPQKRLFRHVAARLGAPCGRCVMVGDSYRRDIAGALRAGWRAVWIGGRARRRRFGAKTPAVKSFRTRPYRAGAGTGAEERLRVAASIADVPGLFRFP